MSKIFVSYRQKGTLMRTGRIADALISAFGKRNVFQDRAILHGGLNWQEAIEKALKDCVVLVAVIGPRWLEHKTEKGLRRIDDPDDYVLFEIATVLKRRIPVIPVLVEGAQRLQEKDLPLPLKALAYVEPLKIEDDSWGSGTDTLLKLIKRSHLNPDRIGWKIITSIVLSVFSMSYVGENEVLIGDAIIGLCLTLPSLALSLRSYYEHREGSRTGRSWAIGAIIFSVLTIIGALDGLKWI